MRSSKSLSDASIVMMSRNQLNSAPRLKYGTSEGDNDHSNTNIQVKGVDEADIIKTDGQFIYYLNNNRLSIVKTEDPDKMEQVNTIEFEFDNILMVDEYSHLVNPYRRSSELFLYGEYVAVILTLAISNQGINTEVTEILIYNVKDPSQPTLERRIKLSGAICPLG